mgnify:CR=1 FL=1|tara:strand:+ start:643 stop:918 length:276 start_codon:yes stop_codon:yes gene_type:complete
MNSNTLAEGSFVILVAFIAIVAFFEGSRNMETAYQDKILSAGYGEFQIIEGEREFVIFNRPLKSVNEMTTNEIIKEVVEDQVRRFPVGEVK